MTIEPERDQFFQYATYGIIGLTLVICLCYSLVFLNPRANPIGALRPAAEALPTSTFVLPATWTPTLTFTPTETPTPEPTGTPTDTPTNTPTDTKTPVPTRVPTRRPTSRPIIPTAIPTAIPPATSVPPTNTPAPPSNFKIIKFEQSADCKGQWKLSGTVWNRGYGKGLLPGTLIRVWVSGSVYTTDVAGSHNKNNAAYWEVIFPKNQAKDGSVAIINSSGNIISPRRAFHLTKACSGKGAVTQITIDFARDD